MELETIKQTVNIPATPDEVYDALMDSKRHSEVISDDAKIENKVGGRFSTFGDYATGKFIELSPGKKIVQTWRAKNWSEGHFSTITMIFCESPEGTIIDFEQKNVPKEEVKNIHDGWNDYYWGTLIDYFRRD